MGEDIQKGGESPQMIFKTARTYVGVTQERFGRLLGRDKSMIYKREKGLLGLTGPSKTLAQIIIRMKQEGMESRIESCLDDVPVDRRSESNAVLALISLCLRENKFHVIEEVIGLKIPEGVDFEDLDSRSEDHSMDATKQVIQDIGNRIKERSRSRKVSKEARDKYERAVLLFAQGRELLDMAYEAEQLALKDEEEEGADG